MQLIEIVYNVYLKCAVFAMYIDMIDFTVNSSSDPFVNTTFVCVSVALGKIQIFNQG